MHEKGLGATAESTTSATIGSGVVSGTPPLKVALASPDQLQLVSSAPSPVTGVLPGPNEYVFGVPVVLVVYVVTELGVPTPVVLPSPQSTPSIGVVCACALGTFGNRELFCNPSILPSRPTLVVVTISKTATVNTVLRFHLAFIQVPFLVGYAPQRLVCG